MTKEIKVRLVSAGGYTEESVKRAIAEFNAKGGAPGEVSPDYAHATMRRLETIDLDNVGFTTTNLVLDGNEVMGSIRLGGPKAGVLEELMGSPNAGFTIRGLCKINITEHQPIREMDYITGIDFVQHHTLGHQVTESIAPQQFSIPELIANVVQWSTDRGIIANAKVLSQVGKYYEESGELAGGVCKKKHDLAVDSVGDALVVLTNVLALAGDDLTSYVEDWDDLGVIVPDGTERTSPLWCLHKHQLHTALLFDGYLEHKTIDANHVHLAITYLNTLAISEGETLRHCFNIAWEEIKDRKGFLTPEGVFVKEADA